MEEESTIHEQLQPSPSQIKQTFVDRLDESGVLDLFSDAIASIYLSPKAATDLYPYFLSLLQISETTDIEKILTENQELRKQITSLKSQIADLESKMKK